MPRPGALQWVDAGRARKRICDRSNSATGQPAVLRQYPQIPFNQTGIVGVRSIGAAAARNDGNRKDRDQNSEAPNPFHGIELYLLSRRMDLYMSNAPCSFAEIH